MRHARNIIAKCGPETRECAAFAQWFRLKYPIEWRATTHIPNERQDKIDKIILAELGTKPGASDYGVFVPRHGYAGMWLEGKRTGATWSDVTPDQRLWLSTMSEAGFFPAVGYGGDHMRQIVDLYLGREETFRPALMRHHYGARISAKRERKSET